MWVAEEIRNFNYYKHLTMLYIGWYFKNIYKGNMWHVQLWWVSSFEDMLCEISAIFFHKILKKSSKGPEKHEPTDSS